MGETTGRKENLKSRENVKIVFDPQCEKGLSLTKLNYTQKRRCVSDIKGFANAFDKKRTQCKLNFC